MINYSNYDFDDLVQQIQARLKNKSAWKDVYRSGTGQMLIEFLAYVAQLVLFYIERRAEESFLPTAQLKSSVINLVSLVGYKPKRMCSARGILKFYVDSPATKSIIIPKYTECQAQEYKYITIQDGVIQKGGTSVTVEAIQGELIEIQISADGTPSQEYSINDTKVENSSESLPTFEIIVDSEKWNEVDSFINSKVDDKHYKIITEPDGSISIKFGDGINGLIPPAGSIILVKYIRTEGKLGNVSQPNEITNILSTIYDIDGYPVSNVKVTNEFSFSGGSDAETIEEIRYNAPRVFKTGDRAVTREDFISLLESYPSIVCANVWGENEIAKLKGVPADKELLNTIKICAILSDWSSPDSNMQKQISDWLYEKSMIAIAYEWIDREIIDIIPILDVIIKKGYSISKTIEDIKKVIYSQFDLGKTSRIGEIIKYSRIIAAIQELEAISYLTLILEIKKELSDTYSSTHDWGVTLPALPVKPQTVNLYVDNAYITTDIDNHDGTGQFSYTNGITISGTINYTTGEILIDITGSTPESVFVRYQQDKGQNIVSYFNQICKLNDAGPEFKSITEV